MGQSIALFPACISPIWYRARTFNYVVLHPRDTPLFGAIRRSIDEFHHRETLVQSGYVAYYGTALFFVALSPWNNQDQKWDRGLSFELSWRCNVSNRLHVDDPSDILVDNEYPTLKLHEVAKKDDFREDICSKQINCKLVERIHLRRSLKTLFRIALYVRYILESSFEVVLEHKLTQRCSKTRRGLQSLHFFFFHFSANRIPLSTDDHFIFPRILFCIMDSSALRHVFIREAFHRAAALVRKAVFACANPPLFWISFRDTRFRVRNLASEFRVLRFNCFIVSRLSDYLTVALKGAALLSTSGASGLPRHHETLNC